MNRCKGRCLILAIAQGKVGEDIGDWSSKRKYCGICEIYFVICRSDTMPLLQKCSTLSF